MNRAERRRQQKIAEKGRPSLLTNGLPSNVTDVVQQALGLAAQHHGAGRLPEAENIYQQILKNNPNQPNALYFLGQLAHQVGRNEIAVELFSKALTIAPKFVDGYNSLGVAHHNLGNMDEAVASFQNVLALKPNHAVAQNNLGGVLKDLGKLEEAVANWRKAIAIDPKYVEAHYNLGRALNDLGEQEEAAACYHIALAINPNYIEAHNSLGITLQVLGKLDEAAVSYGKALAINPDFISGHNNLGLVLHAMGKFDEAADSYHRALAATPNYADARINLGILLKDLGWLDKALDQYERVLKFDPENSDAHNKKSTVLLLLGELEKGWKEYEWRWKRTSEPLLQRSFPQPRWNGEPLQGKSILLWGEQGIGDEIACSSMVPDLVSSGARCTIECEPRLVDLFARSFPEARVRARPYTEAESGADEFDFQIPAGSLFAQFRNSITDFSDRKSFLVIDEERQKMWQDRLSALGSGLKVGVSWRSGVTAANRNANFADIADLEPLFSLKNVVFINLQYGDCGAELAEIFERYSVTLHAWDDINMKNDIDDTAAMISCLDIVVTCLTSVYSMSGGVGVPTFGFCVPNLNWHSLGTVGVPYYPSVRLFKRSVKESWNRVFSEITFEISRLSDDYHAKKFTY